MPCDQKVVELVIEGHVNESIGHQLDLKPDTVKFYLKRIFDKMQVTNRTELAVKVLRERHAKELQCMRDELKQEIRRYMLTASLIRRHEGLRLEAYRDTAGKLTIGYGFNLDAGDAKAICGVLKLDYEAIRNGSLITEAQADAILDLQLGMVNAQAKTLFPNFNQMPCDVQAVVQDLIFNLGLAGFSKFHDTIASLKAGDWPTAADHLSDSLWFRQVGSRAVEDVALLRGA